MERKYVPVLLLTGYLGSGKTTLVNRILANRRGIRFAVIVNDIGEVNIDASLIQKGGIVDQKDDSLVALQNGCICCTLKDDLVDQIFGLLKSGKFDYIVIEASGICEPEPIAQTICSIPSLGEAYRKYGVCRLDCIVSVVDALRFQSEFACGDALVEGEHDDEDIENLIISQIEFCNKIVLNKVSEVSAEELGRIRQILRTLQPSAEIIECDYAEVELDDILNTGMFDFEKVATSAGWIRGIEGRMSDGDAVADGSHGHCRHDDNACDCHGDGDHGHGHDHHDEGFNDECGHGHHHHDHCHCHEGGEVEEYGIGTFVYFRRRPFDLNRFDRFVVKKWPSSVIRTKGICYFSDNMDMSCLFEQAGKQKILKEAGLWYAAAPEDELLEIMKREPGLVNDWDPDYGDRMQKLVFIGQKMDREQIIRDLDECLVPDLQQMP